MTEANKDWSTEGTGNITVTAERLANPCVGCVQHDNLTVKSLCCNSFAIDAPAYGDTGQADYAMMMFLLTRSKRFTIQADYPAGKPSPLVEHWSVIVNERCDHLQDDGRCGVYDKRPPVCANHTPFPMEGEEYENGFRFCERYTAANQQEKIMDSMTFNDPWVFAEFVKEHFGFDYKAEQQEFASRRLDMRFITVV